MNDFSSPEARNWNMFCHLSALAGLLIPAGNILGPLIIWLIKKAEMPSVDDYGKEALNFQLSMTIYFIAAGLSLLVVIGIVLLPVLGVAWLVLVIVASVKASNGEFYHYPLTIRFLN